MSFEGTLLVDSYSNKMKKERCYKRCNIITNVCIILMLLFICIGLIVIGVTGYKHFRPILTTFTNDLTELTENIKQIAEDLNKIVNKF